MNLSDRALIVRLSISEWSARKYDKRASQQVADANGTSVEAGRYNKALLPMDNGLKDIKASSNALRKHVYENTLPWAHDGQFILPTTRYLGFTTRYRELKDTFERHVNNFLTSYKDVKDNAKSVLGTLYDEADYPSVEDVRKKFNVDMEFMPVPTNDFRVEIASDELSRIQADVVSRVEAAQNQAMQAAWQKLYDRVEHMANTLSKDNPRIYDSTVGHIQELCTLLTDLNLTDDPDLERMRQEVERRLGNTPVDVLRNDEEYRKQVADTAADIMSRMGAFMGTSS
jgi:dGTP triphosphohydrolase